MKRTLLIALILICTGGQLMAGGLKKTRDFVIYQDAMFYATFPSLVVRPDGEILCAFRRAPDRKALWGAPGPTHTDANSYLVLVRSKDGGKTWSKDPELIFAHPLGGSQDPCMVQMKDGTIICTSYGWALLPEEKTAELKQTLSHGQYSFLGGYVVRSDDGGHTWKGPFVPPVLPDEFGRTALGKPSPTFNRGAMMQGKDGKLYWAVVRKESGKTSVHLITSSDRAKTWKYMSPIAVDDKITFNETSMVETKKGDLVAFMRTANYDDHLAVGRSTDGGKSFKWEDGKIIGHPYHALKLPDGRVFLVYGYRHEPYGVRARLLNADCTDIDKSPELVIRDDGGTTDLGYPWSALLPDGKIMVAYYINFADGTRHIEGSVLSVD
jgi:sialidase-1